MGSITTYLSELPYIITITLAVYLAFEYWNFPDLTIESSFTSGMVVAFIALTYSSTYSIISIPVMIFVFAIFYSTLTWSFALLKMPPLFAGFLVVLASYSLNYKLNGSLVTQSGFLPETIGVADYLSMPVIHVMAIFALLASLIIALIISFFDRTKLGKSIYLARKIPDKCVVKSLGLKSNLLLLTSMIIYNSIALSGGALYALSNDLSGVSFLGAISPGLASMFIVKAVRDYSTMPSTKKLPRRASSFSHSIVKHTDSMFFIVGVLIFLSILVTLVRFYLRELGIPQGMLNAYTAIGTFAVWGLVSLIAYLSGKDLGDNSNGF